jgi:hypothetical protein
VVMDFSAEENSDLEDSIDWCYIICNMV